MKAFALALFTFLLQSPSTPPQTQQAPRGSIEGVVLRVGTNEAVAARVFLNKAPSPGQPPLMPAAAIASYVSTDDKGRFLLKDITPGLYRIVVAANGYAKQEYGQRVPGGAGTTIDISGQPMKDVVIRMTPAGNVTGRMNDERGQPVIGAQVQLFRISYNANGQRLYQSAGTSRTNDLGEYRSYWVTPGRYYVAGGSISPIMRPLNTGTGVSTNGIQESYAVTYYPGVQDVKEASIIDVRPGLDVSAIDFIVPRQKLYRIRGRVVDPRTLQTPPGATINLSSRSLVGTGTTTQSIASAYNSGGGTFEIKDVAPGAYVVTAQVQHPSTPVPASRPSTLARTDAEASIVVVNGDVDNVVLTVVQGTTLPARLSVEGQGLPPFSDLDRIRVRLNMLSGSGLPFQQPSAQGVNSDGTLNFDDVVPGQYRVSVTPLPVGFYLKEVRFDQIDAMNRPLQFTGTFSRPLEILISPKAGQVAGSVVDEKQQAVPDIQVVLVPNQERERVELFKTATTDQNGRFVINSIAPGDYKLFAWEAIEQYAYFDSEFLQRFEPKAKSVHVAESDKLAVEVKLIDQR